MYLKQKNDYAQRVLSSYAEPLSAYAYFMHGTSYPIGLIDQSWKLLLQNHPHDSICGCSMDEVHRQMMSRFSGVIDTGEQIVRGHLSSLAPTFAQASTDDGATTICVANPLPEGRTEVVERLVVLQPSGANVEQLRLFDQDGMEVPFELVNQEYVERFWGVDYRTELYGVAQLELFQIYRAKFGKRIIRTEAQRDVSDSFLTVHFLAEHLPGVGHRQYYLRERVADKAVDAGSDVGDVTVVGNYIENEYYRVRVHQDGTFDLVDKATGYSYERLNRLEDTEDVGDEYDYSPCRDSQTVTSDRACGAIRTVKASRYWGQLEVEYTIQLPRAIECDRHERSKQFVDCGVRSRVGLKKGSRVVEIELHFENHAEDHRLRVEFPTGLATDTVISDGHFYINHRPIDEPAGENWKQPPQPTKPQQDFTLLQNGEQGFAVLNKGLPEIQAERNADGEVKLSLTLLRAVGWLSRDDVETRRCQNAGPTLYTPEAQCLGEHDFQYAVVLFAGDYISADIKGISQRYRVPVVAIQGVEDGHVPGAHGLVQKTSQRTCISAIKKHDVRDTLEVRLYNLTGDAVEERFTFGRPVTAAWLLDLVGERLRNAQLSGERELVLSLGPHEIVTLEMELKSL
jgi:alpha-mannosidase